MLRYILVAVMIGSLIPSAAYADNEPPAAPVEPLAAEEQAAEYQQYAPGGGSAVSEPEPELQINKPDALQYDDYTTAPAVDISSDPPAVPPVIPSDPTPSAPDEAPALLVSEVQLRGCMTLSDCKDTKNSKHDAFIELYNPSLYDVDVTGWTVEYVTGSGKTVKTVAALEAVTVQAHGYLVIVKQGREVSGTATAVSVPEVDIGSATDGHVRLRFGGAVKDIVGWGAGATLAVGQSATAPVADFSLQRCEQADGIILNTNHNRSDFQVYAVTTPGGGVRCVTAQEPDASTPSVNDCVGVQLSEIGANLPSDQQFIEVANRGLVKIDLTGCLLQTNRSDTKVYAFPAATILPAGGYMAVFIDQTELTLTKTSAGIVYVLSSDGTSEVAVQSYDPQRGGVSLAWFDDGTWRSTYAPTPHAANIDQPNLPCDDGYERNLTTGRCNKVVVAVLPASCGEGRYRSDETGRCRSIGSPSVPSPCKEGQYRSEETNRCRSIASAVRQLVPCRDDQYRSELTNRCRLIASASSQLKPCKDNQYRSEETNRCRTIVSTTVPAAAFAVEPVADGRTVFVGWGLLAGVAVVALGYGAWEWRHEMAAGARKIAAHLRRRP